VVAAARNHCPSGSYARCGPEMIIVFQICTFVRTVFRRRLINIYLRESALPVLGHHHYAHPAGKDEFFPVLKHCVM